MREDEISRYTADSDVLDMMDFRDIPADELEGTEDYIDAQATVAEGIHDALRAAQWAKMYRGVRLDKEDIDGLQARRGTAHGWQCTRKKMQGRCLRSCKACDDTMARTSRRNRTRRAACLCAGKC